MTLTEETALLVFREIARERRKKQKKTKGTRRPVRKRQDTFIVIFLVFEKNLKRDTVVHPKHQDSPPTMAGPAKALSESLTFQNPAFHFSNAAW